MKKQAISVFVLLSVSSSSYANWLEDIWVAVIKYGSGTNNLLGQQLTLQQQLLNSQRDTQKLTDQINGNLTSHSGYGTYQLHDYQSYGGGVNNWNDVVNMADHGRGNGSLGEMIGSISSNFPYDTSTYNRGVTNPQLQQFYATKAQTTLVTRAASELEYNKIQDQITYQQMLMKQIESTKDIKASMDLANRIQVEGNLINLQILRQSALVNQQQAVTEQASVMSALSNAKFLNK